MVIWMQKRSEVKSKTVIEKKYLQVATINTFDNCCFSSIELQTEKCRVTIVRRGDSS